MKTFHFYILILLCLLSFTISSCNDVNDWLVDGSYNRLFRTTNFEEYNLEPTSVTFTFKGVNQATKYVFEFYENDSLEFTNMTNSVEILADTLTPYSDDDAVVNKIYHVTFSDLKGTTPYSVRMKAVNDSLSEESGYVELYFETPDEQILTDVSASIDNATFVWTAGLSVTHINYWKSGGDTAKYELSASEIAAGSATITGLSTGTSYGAAIYNNDAKRGTASFTTLGTKASGRVIRLTPDEATAINDSLTSAVSAGDSIATLVFEADNTYEIGTITIPDGIKTLYFVGDVGVSNAIPELYLYKINMSAAMNSIQFQKVELNARLNSANYVFNIGTANCFNSIGFENCTIRNIGRSLLRLNYADLDISSIKITDCLVDSVGISGYGLINMSKAVTNIGLISITNSTLTEIGSDRLMQLNGGVQQLVVDECTFCNYVSKSTEIFRFDKQPGSVSVTKSIFAGTNNSSSIKAGSADYSSYLEFSTCYVTADLPVNTTYPFTNATTLSLTSEELFSDPRNGNFYLKDGVTFAGEGKVGDPRWW